MIKFTKYNVDSGLITSHGMCQPQLLNGQAGPDEAVILGHFDANDFKIVDGEVVGYSGPSDAVKNEEALRELRTIRRNLLTASDWTQIMDSPLSIDGVGDWQVYRQKLRDLPADHLTITSIDDVTWPDEP
jgi:hypothetical protein